MSKNSIIPDFFCTFSKEFPIILREKNIVLGLSTIDTNKLIFLRGNEENNIVQFLRNFEHPTGLAIKDDFLAVASRSDLQLFRTNHKLAKSFPGDKNKFDQIFLPKLTYHCGNVDLHDIAFVNEKIIGISTAYSCLLEFSDSYSFNPIWKPDFITDLKNEDRCHLNGLAIKNGEIVALTALGKTNYKEGWRKNKVNGGVLIDYKTKEILLDQLGAPHSPTISGNEIFIALSATGEILKYNMDTKEHCIIANLAGYVRGIKIIDDYIFVGLSKLRNKSLDVIDFPVAKKQLSCGIYILSKKTGNTIAHLHFEKDVNEIYSIQLFKNSKNTILFSNTNEPWKYSTDTPNFSHWKNSLP
ncbi:MAG: TIGR03032 family protein [Prolixibacteraceae bacterium]|jgi:uncharacterized protein (TIGR03032 family)|nr:TIGR03032 family protein [Prolixibacteraceae bacterium]